MTARPGSSDKNDLQCSLENGTLQLVTKSYKQLAEKLTHRKEILLVDERIIIQKSLRYTVLNELHFGHHRVNEIFAAYKSSDGRKCAQRLRENIQFAQQT